MPEGIAKGGWLSDLWFAVWPLGLTALLSWLVFFGLNRFLTFFSGTNFLTSSDRQIVAIELRVLAFSGALGGFVSGFIEDRRLHLCVYPVDGKQQIEFGALADVVTGVAGAWGIFFVLGRTLSLGATPNDALTLIGLGVVAGFGAKSLLVVLSERAKKAVETAKQVAMATATEVAATKAAEVATTTATQVAVGAAKESGKKAEDYSDSQRITAVVDLSKIETDITRRTQLLAIAEDIANTVLEKTADSPQVLVALARVERAKADLLPPEKAAEKQELLKKAVQQCSRAVEIRPDLEWGYYNRACYKALTGEPASSVAEDVREAVKLLAENRTLFLHDDDLAKYWNLPEIAALLENKKQGQTI